MTPPSTNNSNPGSLTDRLFGFVRDQASQLGLLKPQEQAKTPSDNTQHASLADYQVIVYRKELYQKRERPEERYFAALSKGLVCNCSKYSIK